MAYPEMLLALTRGPLGAVLAGVWGALWGSFFNVVICRLPAGESLIHPPSHCRSCRQPVRWYDNVPILSYLLLRGRCRHCGQGFSARYPMIELLVALLAVAMYWVYVAGDVSPLGVRLARFVITSLFCGLLVAIAVIDIDTMLILNVITYPGIPLASALSLLMPLPRWWDGPLGAVAGYLLIRLFADGYRLLTGRQGMGYGDAKLMAMVGALQGWQVLLPVLFLASFQGSVIGITLLVLLRRRRARDGQSSPPATVETDASVDGESRADDHKLRHARIPFGPFISLAAIELLGLRERLMRLFPYLR